jgi:hypothetical protein
MAPCDAQAEIKRLTERVAQLEKQLRHLQGLEVIERAVEHTLNLDDMSEVGRRLMHALRHSYPDYHWIESPTEVVTDLLNKLEDQSILHQADHAGQCAEINERELRIQQMTPDATRLDKLPQCFHMLRYRNGLWHLTYETGKQYAGIREAIDAHHIWDAGAFGAECAAANHVFGPGGTFGGTPE